MKFSEDESKAQSHSDSADDDREKQVTQIKVKGWNGEECLGTGKMSFKSLGLGFCTIRDRRRLCSQGKDSATGNVIWGNFEWDTADLSHIEVGKMRFVQFPFFRTFKTKHLVTLSLVWWTDWTVNVSLWTFLTWQIFKNLVLSRFPSWPAVSKEDM